MKTVAMVVALTVGGAALAVESAGEVTQSAAPAPRWLRARAGVLAGLAMQKVDGELGVAADLVALGSVLRLVADLTFGFRPLEVSLSPELGLRLPIALRTAPRLHPWFAFLTGTHFTFMRGGVAVALPFRAVAGLHYDVHERLAVGLEVSFEAGPLVVPFVDGWAAAHLAASVAWGI